MTRFREWPLTLCLIVAAFAGLFAVSCRLLPVKPLPSYSGTAERNPYLPPSLVTNVLALPTPPGAPVALMTNVARIRPAAMALAVVTPRVVTNIVSIREQIPPNGGNDTNRRWTILQATHDLTHWSTVTSNEQISGHYVTNDVTSTNRVTFYRTVSQ